MIPSHGWCQWHCFTHIACKNHQLVTTWLPCSGHVHLGGVKHGIVFFLHFELSLVASRHFYVGLTFVILKYVYSCLILFKYVYSCQIPNLLVRQTIHLFGGMSLLVKYWNTVISLGWGKTSFWTYQLFVFPWVLSIQPNLGSVGSTNFHNFLGKWWSVPEPATKIILRTWLVKPQVRWLRHIPRCSSLNSQLSQD